MGEQLSGCAPVCCQSPSVVEVPGIQGQSGTTGTAGADGISAVTATTANFVIPAINSTVNIFVASSAGLAVDQNIVITGGYYFVITAILASNSITIKYLNYQVNVNTGLTITGGARVVPGGLQPTAPTVLPLISFYGVGGSQNLTNAAAQILSSAITLTATQSYLLFATARFGYVGATFAANQTLTVKIRRTNNTATDISNAIQTQVLAIVTTITYGIAEITIPLVSYSGTSGDILQIYALVSTVPSAGNVQAVECSLVAMPVS